MGHFGGGLHRQSLDWYWQTKQYRKIQINKLHTNQKSKQPKIQQNKTTLFQLPLATLGQETRWAYSTTLPSPHGVTMVTWFRDCLAAANVNNAEWNHAQCTPVLLLSWFLTQSSPAATYHATVRYAYHRQRKLYKPSTAIEVLHHLRNNRYHLAHIWIDRQS